jgi:hypothetical protein
MKFLLATALLSSFAFSQCFNFNAKDVEVKWVAFKTPSKVGVPGWFKELGLKNDSYTGKDIADTLTGLSFNINTSSTYTENSQRDAKIVKFFFGKMSGSKISGGIKKANESEIILELNMNKTKREVPLRVELKDNKLIATGVMDIFDFNMGSSLKGINKACEQLHLGKTWNDVELELSIPYNSDCPR